MREPAISAVTWDFIVAGAGPAGCRTAELLARRGESVLLLDPKAPWEKPCGGGLTAAAWLHTPELQELQPESRPVLEVLVIAPSGKSAAIPLGQPCWVVSRVALSRWGLERAGRAGAVFRRRAVESVTREADGWSVVDATGEVHRALRLVAADGAASRLRGRLAPHLRPELDPARLAYPREEASGQGPSGPQGRAVIQFFNSTQGYLWDFPRPDHHSLGACVTPGTWRRAELDEAIRQYRLVQSGESTPIELQGAVIPTSLWIRGRVEDLAGADYAIVGDAAGLADPATGEGIDYALRSATLAVESYDPCVGFRRYPDRLRVAFRTEARRARFLRRWCYHGGMAEWLVGWARRSPRGVLALAALLDAINEHRPLLAVVRRVAFPSRADLAMAEEAWREAEPSRARSLGMWKSGRAGELAGGPAGKRG